MTASVLFLHADSRDVVLCGDEWRGAAESTATVGSEAERSCSVSAHRSAASTDVPQHCPQQGEVDLIGIAIAHAAFAAIDARKPLAEPLDRRGAGVKGDVALLGVEADGIVPAGRAIAGHAPLHSLLPIGQFLATGRPQLLEDRPFGSRETVEPIVHARCLRLHHERFFPAIVCRHRRQTVPGSRTAKAIIPDRPGEGPRCGRRPASASPTSRIGSEAMILVRNRRILRAGAGRAAVAGRARMGVGCRQDKSPRCAGRAVGGVCRVFGAFPHIAAPNRTSRPSGFLSLLIKSRTSQEIGP